MHNTFRLPHFQPSHLPCRSFVPRCVDVAWNTLMRKGPKYDGNFLHKKIKDLVGDTKLADTLSNVVMPAFDVKRMQPILFNTLEAEREAHKNAYLADVCLATSAAPTFLPARSFCTWDSGGEPHEFQLIDGGVAANNPTMVAMSLLTKEMLRLRRQLDDDRKLPLVQGDDGGVAGNNNNNPTTAAMKALIDTGKAEAGVEPSVYRNILVISIGTGVAKETNMYTAEKCNKWNLLDWVSNNGFNPLIDFLSYASADLVDIQAAVLFEVLSCCKENYLRIQTDELMEDAASVDRATEKNMEELIKFGNKLLKDQVTRVNIETGVYEPVKPGYTNEMALKDFAGKLCKERKLRQTAHE
ncbi:Patatin-like protein 3 [Dichanthelium oligosanthes]|uniref:Patatin n=1 Tax=Dichanthelium oligosanthes TaxID=888268 RepID=A0A1E5VEU4_9POAL|nr:Patatin-like protein 3 [Dichanthelium oligosanthes]